MRIIKKAKPEEIVNSLITENNKYFHITDLEQYAQKVLTIGKIIGIRDEDKLVSYILYYDNEVPFITMVWVHPDYRRQGLSKKILSALQTEFNQIKLEVHKDNPAKIMYDAFGFRDIEQKDDGQVIQEWNKSISIMQPYTYPFQGYFNLIESTDHIVFYDDVNFIKRGYIHRNSILCNGQSNRFTVNLHKASQNDLIKDVCISDTFDYSKFLKTIYTSYRKAPYFEEVYNMLLPTPQVSKISDFAIDSIQRVYSYLGLKLNYSRSSEFFSDSIGMERADRLIQIAKDFGSTHYTNASGGRELYKPDYFKTKGITLNFCDPIIKEYKQFNNEFTPYLSIIDILMFNSVKDSIDVIRSYDI